MRETRYEALWNLWNDLNHYRRRKVFRVGLVRSITTDTISLHVTYHTLKNIFKQHQDTSFQE